MSMTNAVVLIEAERDALSSLGGALADIEGVAEAYSVTGQWDFVAIVRVPHHEQLADVVTGREDRRARQGPNDDGSNLRRLGGMERLGQVIDEMDAQGVDGRAVEGDPGDLVGDLASNEGLLFFLGDHGISLGTCAR